MNLTGLATKRAVGYQRVSSQEQAGERHVSLATQEARVAGYCASRSMPVVGTFHDICSGRRDDRVEYQRMLAYLREGNADVVVIQFLDRFGRNPKEILSRIWELQEQGVSVEATDEDIREELMLLIKAGFAGQESRRISERVRATMTKAVESKGVQFGRAPYGLRRVKTVKGGRVETTWEVDPETAPIVREMWRLSVVENMGFKAIADGLTGQGLRTQRGRPFTAFSVQIILSNEALVGNLVYGKNPKRGSPPREIVRRDGYFPALLSKDEWDRLQKRLGIRRLAPKGRGHRSPFLLSGLLRCGTCGGPMCGKYGSGRNAKYTAYYCTRAAKSKALCPTFNSHAAGRLERAVLEALTQYADPKLAAAKFVQDGGKALARLEAELKSIDKRLAEAEHKLKASMNMLAKGVLDEDQFARLSREEREERAKLIQRRTEVASELDDRRQKAESAQAVPGKVKGFLAAFGTLTIPEAKGQLQLLLKAIRVTRDNMEIDWR